MTLLVIATEKTGDIEDCTDIPQHHVASPAAMTVSTGRGGVIEIAMSPTPPPLPKLSTLTHKRIHLTNSTTKGEIAYAPFVDKEGGDSPSRTRKFISPVRPPKSEIAYGRFVGEERDVDRSCPPSRKKIHLTNSTAKDELAYWSVGKESNADNEAMRKSEELYRIFHSLSNTIIGGHRGERKGCNCTDAQDEGPNCTDAQDEPVQLQAVALLCTGRLSPFPLEELLNAAEG
ncbi:unnamed protein product [Zymoseptoria tritici ST99CH_3D1]|uniref:Uncharacterized protein n=1 Tax=Zymoseptoria tritici ST99CH_1E4 TaxID=1276532 RepID=A0A2H1H8Y9_ZYMTR|nr:unnamed protein product [Zymoseptoria tritici ST99CH_1E4]SMR64753.1 unnamed protein product [Zymoseptoria tritici ST99CH_3D1]